MFKKIINFINSKIKSSEYYSSPHALLYRRILESSYDNTFYANLKVPDTIDGRFDVIILHIFVFIKIFKNSSDVEKNFTQKLFDIFMIEVESSYREMGKKMKIVIESFYGRTKLYDQYFDDEEEFSRCLLQNIWDNDKERDKESRKLYHFVCQKVNKYKDKSLRDVLIISSRGF
jgi:hypothetical protein